MFLIVLQHIDSISVASQCHPCRCPRSVSYNEHNMLSAHPRSIPHLHLFSGDVFEIVLQVLIKKVKMNYFSYIQNILMKISVQKIMKLDLKDQIKLKKQSLIFLKNRQQIKRSSSLAKLMPLTKHLRMKIFQQKWITQIR